MRSKSIILFIFIITSISAQESWNSTIFDYLWNSTINRTKFREPVIATPIDFRFGLIGYGGTDYWNSSGFITRNSLISPIILDSTETNFNLIDEPATRLLFSYDIDLARYNLSKFLKTNQFDFQIGLGYHHSNSIVGLDLPDGWVSAVSEQSNDEYQFKPSINMGNINTSLSFQPVEWIILSSYYSFGAGRVTLYESYSGSNYLEGLGYGEDISLGIQFPVHNKINSYGIVFGVQSKWKRIFVEKFNDRDNISPIVALNSSMYGIDFNFSIIFGGKRTSGDIGYTQLINNRFSQADSLMEVFIDTYPNHQKVKDAIYIQEFCNEQIPYQYFKSAVNDIENKRYDDAIKNLVKAEQGGLKDLKIDIEIRKEDLANIFIKQYLEKNNKDYSEESEDILLKALSLLPTYGKTNKLLSDLLIQKGDQLIRYGSHNAALKSYNKAIKYYPDNQKLINHRYENLAVSLINNANKSINKSDFFLALANMKKTKLIQPELKDVLEKSIKELTDFINQDFNIDSNDRIQNLISRDKSKYIKTPVSNIVLGMTASEVDENKGTPSTIDRLDYEGNKYEMWIYKDLDRLEYYYFKNYLLIRIEK